MGKSIFVERTKSYFIFIKIGQEEHLDQLQAEGHLFCNTLKYHRKSEEIGVKGDRNEGMSFIKQVSSIDINVKVINIRNAKTGLSFNY